MKIIEIGSSAMGGVTEYTKELVNSLVSLGIDVSHFYISNRHKSNMLQKYNPISWLITWQKIKKTDPDIIHIQYTPTICGPFFPLFLIFLRLVRAKPKLIITAHEKPTGYLHHLNFITKKMFMLYEKKIFKFCDKIIVHTLDHKQELLNRYNIRLNKIAIIPHPVMEPHTSDQITIENVAKKCELDSKEIITYFGFIRPHKGIDYLIKAFSSVLEVSNDDKKILLIAGSTPKIWSEYLIKLKKLVKRDGIEEYVIFTDYVSNEEMSAIFSGSKIIVLPYLLATQSGVLHQAIAYGKPVITTDVGGVGETVKKYNIGCVVPPRDSRAIADAILGMLDNPEEMGMFRKNELKVAEELSQKNIAKMHVDLYNRIIPRIKDGENI